MPKAEAPAELFEVGADIEPPGPTATEAFKAWNERADKFNWAVARNNTCGRPARLRKAVKDVGGLPKWRALLDLCGTSDFLCGRTTPRPFRFTLDWALKPANLLKLIDANFIPEGERKAAENAKPVGPVNWRARLEAYRKGGFWLPSDGPRPEEPGPHKAPADMIAEWRARTNLPSLKPVPVETAEDRLRATLGMYEARGRSEDANRIRAKLAALLGHPQEARQEKGLQAEITPGNPAHFSVEGGPHPCVSDSTPPQPGENSRTNSGGEARGKANPNTARAKQPYPADALRLGPHDEEPPAWEGDVPEGDD